MDHNVSKDDTNDDNVNKDDNDDDNVSYHVNDDDDNVTNHDNEFENVTNDDTDDENDDDNSYEVDLGGGQEGGQPTNSYDPNTGDFNPFFSYLLINRLSDNHHPRGPHGHLTP